MPFVEGGGAAIDGDVSASPSAEDAGAEVEIRLRPTPIPDDARWGGLRWFLAWVWTIVHARRFQLRRGWDAAAVLRLTAIAFAISGAVFGALTPSEARITPLVVQALVVLAVWTFAFVGYWMMGWPEERTQALSWAFAVAGATGSLIYASSQYANLALEGSDLPGGMLAGWVADLLFLPAVAILLPPFLVLIAAGRWEGLRRYWPVVALGMLAAGLLFTGMLFEPNLFTHTQINPPLSNSPPASWWRELTLSGLVLLGLSCAFGLVAVWHRDTGKGDQAVIRWYAYGGVLGLVALFPYLLVMVAPSRFFPSAPTFARAWGSLMVALVAVSAIPATAGEPWRSLRMKRLVRGAIIAAAAAALHEFMVIKAVDQVLAKPEEDPQLGGQVFFTYAAILLIAVAFEPLARGFDQATERVLHWRSPPNDLLEEALEDLRGSRRRLNRSIARATRWGREHPDRVTLLHRVLPAGPTTARERKRDRLAGRDMNTILGDIRVESTETNELIDQLEEEYAEMRASRPTNDS